MVHRARSEVQEQEWPSRRAEAAHALRDRSPEFSPLGCSGKISLHPASDFKPGHRYSCSRHNPLVLHHPSTYLNYSFFFLRFYLLETERERDRQAEGEAGSMQGAQCGTRSGDSRIRPWAEGGAKPLSHLGCPYLNYSKSQVTFRFILPLRGMN